MNISTQCTNTCTLYISLDSEISAEQVDSVLRTDNARQLWDTKTELNERQIKSIKLGTSHRLQLIQGPPGTILCLYVFLFVKVSLIGSN